MCICFVIARVPLVLSKRLCCILRQSTSMSLFIFSENIMRKGTLIFTMLIPTYNLQISSQNPLTNPQLHICERSWVCVFLLAKDFFFFLHFLLFHSSLQFFNISAFASHHLYSIASLVYLLECDYSLCSMFFVYMMMLWQA